MVERIYVKSKICLIASILFLSAALGIFWFLESPSVSKSARAFAFSALKDKIGDMPEMGTLIIVDFSQPSQTKRLAVIDLKTGTAKFYGRVAHGKNSGGVYALKLSNQIDSLKSSAGLFKVAGRFYGKHGPSFRLEGLAPRLNGNAEKRGIIIHAATYVSLKSIIANWKNKFRLGRSHGCFVLSNSGFKRLKNNLVRPAYLYAYSSHEPL